MLKLATMLLLTIASCNVTLPPDIGVSGFTDGPKQDVPSGPSTPDLPGSILECPGETQCPCGGADETGSPACPEPLECGPIGGCTLQCTTDADCTSGVSGEACVGGLCAVLCDPSRPHGGCRDAGMPDSECIFVLGANVCGYE